MESSSSTSEIGHVSFAAYITDLSTNNCRLRSLTLTEPEQDRIEARELPIADFCLLLRDLNVPGPCFALQDQKDIASGAQFVVRRGDVGYTRDPKSLYTAAIKSPKFMLHAQERLNLSSESVRRQVSDLLIEVAALRHPYLERHENIVDVIGWGVSSSWHRVPFIALEWASGNLGDLITADVSISCESRQRMVGGIASALSTIHDIGIVHGDLKPENILVFQEESRWVARLSDFGGGAGLGGANSLRGRGTVGWRAPELRLFHDYGEPLDPTLLSRIDIYSFGLLTWSILCWSINLLHRSEEESALDFILHDLQKRQDISEMLKISYLNLVRECLQRQPQDRPPNIVALLPYDEQLTEGNAASDKSNRFTFREHSDDQQVRDEQFSIAPARTSGRGWEFPNIASELSDHLLSAYLEDEDRLGPNMAFGLFISRGEFGFKGLGGPGRIDTSFRLLRTAALGGDPRAQSLIFRCYEYYGLIPDEEIEEHRRAWTFDSIASGCLAFSKAARLMDSVEFDDAIAHFQATGGYNLDYAGTGPNLLARFLDPGHRVIQPGISTDKPLSEDGDYLVHVLCSLQDPTALSVLKTIATSVNINLLNHRGESPLYFACRCGAFDTVIFLLSLGADPTLRPPGDSPSCLHWLIAFHPDRIEEVADRIIEKGASTGILAKKFDKMFHYPFALPAGSPLHWAVEFCCVEATRALLKHSADPWLPNGVEQFVFPMRRPVLKPDSSTDIVDFDAWVLGGSAGSSAVEVAVQNWDHDILRLLLEHAPRKREEKIDDGICVFHHLIAGDVRWISTTNQFFNPLIRGGQDTRQLKIQRTVNVLASFGFDINSLLTTCYYRSGRYRNTGTSLMLAVGSGDIEVATALLEAGADVNLAGSDGRTAIMYLELEYTTDQVDEYDVHRAFQIQTINLLLAHGARVDVRDNTGQSPILALAQGRLFSAVEVLLENGAAVNDQLVLGGAVQEAQDWVVFCRLARMSNLGERYTQIRDRELSAMLRKHVVPLLVQAPSTNPLSSHKTLLHRVAESGFLESAAVLLDAGVHVNVICSYPERPSVPLRTPLDEAIEAFEDNFLPNHWSKLEIAQYKSRSSNMIELLRRHGGRKAKELEAVTGTNA